MMTEEQIAELGRSVYKLLRLKEGRTPRVLTFELFDHKRRLVVCDLTARLIASEPLREDMDGEIGEIIIPDGFA